MVRGQKRFSTSHTFKEEKRKMMLVLKFKRIKSTFFVKNKKKLADIEKFLITGLKFSLGILSSKKSKGNVHISRLSLGGKEEN